MDLRDLFKFNKINSVYSALPFYHLKIVRFRDLTHKNAKLRYWLTFRINQDTSCLLSTFTTSSNKAKRYWCDDNALASLVQISDNEFNPPFSEHTYLDCNLKDLEHRKTFNDLVKCVDWNIGFLDPQIDIPEEITEKIIIAIVNSNFTTPEIKNGFRKVYPQYFPSTPLTVKSEL